MEAPIECPSPLQLEIGGLAVVIRRAALNEILDLRHAVLRAGLPRATASFAGDDAPATLHFGAFLQERNIACATFHRNDYEGQPAWQLRGMATHPHYRGRGIGQAMLRHAEGAIPAQGKVRLLWCNARTPATPFYQRQGWQLVSEEFVIPTAGPHFRMVRRLP
jgi:GNAT superfamily N-acetyltransferase